MYDYRTWTPQQRAAAVVERRLHGYPLHGPPHLDAPGQHRIVTGTCFEHRGLLSNVERLQWFEEQLLATVEESATACAAWVVLPSHYHVLVLVDDMSDFSRAVGRLHGRTSWEFNREDNSRGRRVWYRCEDRCMRSEGHYFTTLNYIHNNPLKHGYVTKWTDWPFSSVHWYLRAKGREWLEDVWRTYPVLNYGEKWDV
jgi:putative transposase